MARVLKHQVGVTLQGTNISPKNGILKMIFLFPRWDMLIPWRVAISRGCNAQFIIARGPPCGTSDFFFHPDPWRKNDSHFLRSIFFQLGGTKNPPT